MTSGSPAIPFPANPCPSQRLLGKVALITGGASGIGESIARLFHTHGAKVCIADVQDGPGRLLCDSLGGEDHTSFVHCNVTIEEDVQRAVDHAAEKYGTIDILVNNAGIVGPKVSDIRQVNIDDFKHVFDVNVHGVFLAMKHSARVMIPRGKGSIISLASVSSVLGGFGPHSYTGSKHAVLGLTKSAAAELGRHGIRVNCVSPYAVPTALGMSHLPEEERTEDVLKGFLSFVGLHANLKGVDLLPGDVANAVLFLASDESKYISGLNMTVDGAVTCVNTTLRQFD
ncbi:hypothetical protein HPP92_018530 [Vanilla planifolia]|uniref:Noroxomaritidine/norcraugsodine reductase n=1 Tax=Vanilla planifolia TaxID=51239 RepID=A0A835QHR6_VANPL|nr:hypothetical protein HPP92_018530 [Vanilla planifolia]